MQKPPGSLRQSSRRTPSKTARDVPRYALPNPWRNRLPQKPEWRTRRAPKLLEVRRQKPLSRWREKGALVAKPHLFPQRSPRLARGVHHPSVRLITGGALMRWVPRSRCARRGKRLLEEAVPNSPSPGCGRGVGVRARWRRGCNIGRVTETPVPSSPALLPRPGEGGACGGFTTPNPTGFHPCLHSFPSPPDERLVRISLAGEGSGGLVAGPCGSDPLARCQSGARALFSDEGRRAVMAVRANLPELPLTYDQGS